MLTETHLTVRLPPGQQDRLRTLASAFDCKLLLIELERGTFPVQPMLSWRQAGDLGETLRHAASLSQRLNDAGFEVVRVKIEVDLARIGIQPACYAEAHFKIRARPADWPRLSALSTAHGAHLSRNAWSRDTTSRDDHSERRFVTLRHTDPRQAGAHFVAFETVLAGDGWEIESRTFEAVLFDDNLRLDEGWLQ
ncbi:hypothetical protein [Ahniella affigens]|nr:hypothetical protein [Ahniella affigens]